MIYFIITFLLIFGTVITGLTIKPEYWKSLEEKYKSIPKKDFRKLGIIRLLDYGNGSFKNMFGLGLNKTGIILYPTFTNKLTHKNILIPYTEIEQYDFDKISINFITYNEVRLYLNRNSLTLTIQENTAEFLINQLQKITSSTNIEASSLRVT